VYVGTLKVHLKCSFTLNLTRVCIQDFKFWTLPPKSRKLVNARGNALKLAGWLPDNLRILDISYKCVVYMHITRSSAWHHLLGGVFPKGQTQALAALIDFLAAVQSADCDIVDMPAVADRVKKMKILRAKAVKTLLLVEREFPKTLLVVCLHNLLHFPDMIGRWNNVRNYWAFFMER
jgi:hypothetical protein